MKKINIEDFKVGQKVLITSYNPNVEATIADMYEVPYEQVPMLNDVIRKKYQGKNVPIFEVFIDGKLLSFIQDVVKKINE